MRPHSTRSHNSLVAAAALAASIFACQPDADPAGLVGPIAASRGSVAFQEELASPGWQATAATLVARAPTPPYAGARLYAFLGVAQYLAVQQAEDGRGGDGEAGGGGRWRRDAGRGAVAGASAGVLSALVSPSAPALPRIA